MPAAPAELVTNSGGSSPAGVVPTMPPVFAEDTAADAPPAAGAKGPVPLREVEPLPSLAHARSAQAIVAINTFVTQRSAVPTA